MADMFKAMLDRHADNVNRWMDMTGDKENRDEAYASARASMGQIEGFRLAVAAMGYYPAITYKKKDPDEWIERVETVEFKRIGER